MGTSHETERNNNTNNSKYTNVPLNEKGEVLLETDEERRTRRTSLWVIYVSVFVQSLGASIVVTGVWPYLNTLDGTVSKEWLGAIVAANPLGQLIFSPLIGWSVNKIDSVRVPSLFCLVVFIFSNAWYALLPTHKSHVKTYMFLARFLVGVSSGSIAACRTFITQGTLTKERTSAISYLSLFQALGFILGPVAQVALTPLGKEGFSVVGDLTVSMYSATGWVASLVGIINLFMFHPRFFQETNIAEKEALAKVSTTVVDGGLKALNEQKEEVNWSKIGLDYKGVLPVIFGFFVVFVNFSLLETLGTPVTIEQLGWSNDMATLRVGIATAISSVISLACFFTIPVLCKRFDERIILILAFVVSLVGRLFFFPFGGPVAPMRTENCVLESTILENIADKASCEKDIDGASWVVQPGCPQEQKWCFEIPALNGITMAIGYAVCTIGYPYSVVLLQTLFSKIIGPRPQGVWMGALTAISSLARIVGPVFVAYIYTKYGTIVTSAAATALQALALLLIVIVYRRLVPIKLSNAGGS